MYCGECGTRARAGQRFCSQCGMPTPEVAAPTGDAPTGIPLQQGLQGLALMPGQRLLPAGNRSAKFTEGGRLLGLLAIRDGRFSFRTILGTEFDVPVDEVDDVRVPGRLSVGNPGYTFDFRIAGAKYRLLFIRLLWPDDPGEQLLRHLQPRGSGKRAAKDFVKSSLEIVDTIGLGAGHLAAGAVDWGLDRALKEEEEKPAPPPVTHPPRKPVGIRPADAFCNALTGKPVPTELTDPAAAAALDANQRVRSR